MQLIDALNAVLEIEETEEILDFTVPGHDILLWPYIRYSFIQDCISLIHPEYKKPTSDVQPLSSRENKSLFFKAWQQTIPVWPRRNIWFYGAYPKSYFKMLAGGLYNPFADPFLCLFPEQSLFLDANPYSDFLPVNDAYKTQRLQPMHFILEKIGCRIYRKLFRDNIQRHLNKFCTFLDDRVAHVFKKKLPKENFEKLCATLMHRIPLFVTEYYFYKAVFKSSRPKLLVINCAHYGRHGHLIKLAKESGACVAENQHGVVASEHIAYNWSKTMCSSKKLRTQLPDVFMSYGEYWHGKMRIPGKFQVIGNPWFAMQAKKIKGAAGQAKGILFALNTRYDSYLPYVVAIQKAFPDLKIVVRPHPAQREMFSQTQLAKALGVTIDDNADIYTTFKKVDCVVGEASTALFEAAALGKRVFVRRGVYDGYLENLPVSFFNRPEEFMEQLSLLESGRMPLQIQNSIFCTNWERNYQDFANKFVRG